MIFIILSMLLYTVATLAGAAASRHLNTNIQTAITNTVSAFVPIIVAANLVAKKTFSPNRFGILMAVLSGMAVGLFVMALNKSFSVNKVGIVTPVVFGGAIFLSTLLSYFIFKEKVSLLQGIGLLLLAAGFITIIYAQVIGK